MSSAVDGVIRKVTCVTFAFGISRLLKKWVLVSGQDSVVVIGTRHGLDWQGIESRWRRDFACPSRLALGPTLSPVPCTNCTAFFVRVKLPGLDADSHHLIAPTLQRV